MVSGPAAINTLSIHLTYCHKFHHFLSHVIRKNGENSGTWTTMVGVEPSCSTMVGYGPRIVFVEGFGADLSGFLASLCVISYKFQLNRLQIFKKTMCTHFVGE